MKHRFLLPCLLLTCLPSLCLADLTPYQQNVVAAFATTGSDKPVREAYEAQNAGNATETQRKVIHNSELIYEDRRLSACVAKELPTDISVEAAVGKIVAAGQGEALVAAARPLFGQGEWETAVKDGDPLPERATGAAALLMSSSTPKEWEGSQAMRALQRRLTITYFMTYATEGKCKPSPQARAMLAKGSK